MSELLNLLFEGIEEELPFALALRERLHANPEPSHREHETARLVAEALGEDGARAVAGTGLLVRTGSPGSEAVVVRAELDALPIKEETGAPFAATNGMMHACGHDVHMAALAACFALPDGWSGCCRYLSSRSTSRARRLTLRGRTWSCARACWVAR